MSFWTSLFGSTHTVSVSSTVYNLAGDEAARSNFLKTTVIGAVLGTNDQTVGEQITNTYLAGPGIQLRGFARWAQNYGYSSLVGMASASIYLVSPVVSATIVPYLPTLAGATTVVQNARIGSADFVFWVEQYMQLNYPTLVDTAYTCDFDATTNLVTITFVDATTTTFTMSGFSLAAQYLYIEYVFDTPGTPAVPEIPATDTTPDIPAVPAGPDTISAPMYLAYQHNTGNTAFDALFNPTTNGGYFFPYIPLRVYKTMISSTYYSDVYTQSVKAVKKSIGASFDDLITKLNTSTSISDIDFAYIVFGVSLNVQENACRSYIYQFFLQIMTAYASSTATPSGYSVSVASTGATAMNFNMSIYWDSISETFGTGVLSNAGTSATAGQFWFQTFTVDPDLPTQVRLNWQVDANNYRYLDIYNLMHVNMVYQGNAVVTDALTALASSTESGFIIPLNEAIFASTPLVDATQMATACCFLVCNAYTIHTTPWYATSLFKVLLVVAVIAVSALTADPATLGLLGSNLAVGTALGLTATSAVIAGAVANSLAAIILIGVIQSGSTALFGSQFGAIVGAIAGLVLLQVGTALMNGASASSLLNTILQPINLLKLTEAAGNGYAQFMELGAQKIDASTQAMLAEYATATANLTTQYQDTFGNNNGVDLTENPLSLIDTTLPNVAQNMFVQESRDDFISRTLLTGSDIVDLSMSFITNFCDANLSMKLKET